MNIPLIQRLLGVLSTAAVVVGTLGLSGPVGAQPTSAIETVEVDLAKAVGPLEHMWANAGSDRAAISMREQWRMDLARFHEEAGLTRVRFHGIFNDELGVYAPGIGNFGKKPNWQNIDRIYDGLLKNGVRPIVELSFMPKRLASGDKTFGFYRGNITPPNDVAAWGDFIKAFVQHLVDHYGLEEVRRWPFEVWNEPDLGGFWSGTQSDYFEMYKASVTAIKAVDARIQVGGPVTSQIQWIPEFLAYCEANSLPVDFVATHIYVGDDQKKIFGQAGAHAPSDVIPVAMARVREQIDATRFKGTPLWLTEWASDSPAMIAHIIKGCLGNVQLMSQWTFTNTYEEMFVATYVLKEGYNGYGMMAVGGIPKPQFNTYKLLHRLGGTRLAATDGPVLASRRADGSSAVAVWNLVEVKQVSGIPGLTVERDVVGQPKKLRVILQGARAGQKVKVSYVDQIRGSPYPEWRRLGSPQYLTAAQIETIRKSAELAAPETMKLGKGGELILDLPPECVALIEIGGAR